MKFPAVDSKWFVAKAKLIKLYRLLQRDKEGSPKSQKLNIA